MVVELETDFDTCRLAHRWQEPSKLVVLGNPISTRLAQVPPRLFLRHELLEPYGAMRR
jgi:hypothetical protein